MPFDALCVSALKNELKNSIIGARIDKIHQPSRDEVIFSLRTRSETGHSNLKLFISANPQQPRAHITELTRENPEVPPMFCMLLRKHLTGARILDVSQPPMERMLEFHLEALDELGFRVPRRLILEAMGRQSNLLLVDNNGRIIDCIRRVERDLSTLKDGETVRQLMSGFFYHYPPSQEKCNPAEETLSQIQQRLSSSVGQVSKVLLSTYSGLSPLICREVSWLVTSSVDSRIENLSSVELQSLSQTLYDIVQQNSPIQPTILEENGMPKDFSFRDIGQYESLYSKKNMSSISALLDSYCKEQERSDRVRQKGQGLIRTLTNARDRVAKKILIQEKELTETEYRDRLRELGDIITANLHIMEQGMSQLSASDFYNPTGEQITIQLDPLKSPQKNAASYYKNYNKAKKANEMLQILLTKGRDELDYLNSVLENTKLAQGEQDLVELRLELEDAGYLKKHSKQKAKVKRIQGKPMEFVSSSGLRISVGKNNLQNDLLTTKLAFKSDIWLHTQKIHGSHVILWTEGKEADLTSLQEAASLAAWFSQGRERGKVPVDYTPVKFVKKPNGAKPGMVIYTTYETAFVTPDEALVENLRRKK